MDGDWGVWHHVKLACENEGGWDGDELLGSGGGEFWEMSGADSGEPLNTPPTRYASRSLVFYTDEAGCRLSLT